MENNIETNEKVGWWKSKSKAAKIRFIASIIVFTIAISFIVIWSEAKHWFGSIVPADFYGNSSINSGWELMATTFVGSGPLWLSTFIALAIYLFIIFVLNFFINLFTGKTKKSKTIGSLLKSLVRYISVIVFIGVVLSIWGVDVAGIVAGVGVITLIVGLGCQSLIQDVVSGLFIVFDDYFSVGDVVIIDGFRGTIKEVGLKTTKVIDFGGNIKSITNSQITTVVNLSREDSLVSVTIGCAYEEDIVRVEGVIEGAMEEFKKKIPAITEGPFYKGIDKIGASSIDFLVLCKCKEADRFQVTRDLNRELILLFKEHDIIIPFGQITINSANPSDRPKASEVEKKMALVATNRNRGIGEKKKSERRKNIFYKAKKALEETSQEIETEMEK